MNTPRDIEHDRERVLGAGYVGSASLRAKPNATLLAGSDIDIPGDLAKLLENAEIRRRFQLLGADAKRLDDECGCLRKLRTHFFLGRDHAHFGWEGWAALAPYIIAPASKVGLVVGGPFGEGLDAVFRCRGVQNDLNDRVKASSSTTMTLPAISDLRVYLQRCQDARVHVVRANQYGELDNLLFV